MPRRCLDLALGLAAWAVAGVCARRPGRDGGPMSVRSRTLLRRKGGVAVSDVIIRVTAEVRDRLAEAAGAEGLALGDYLARHAASLPTASERPGRAGEVRAALRAWNGYDPGEAEVADLDAELDRRLVEARGLKDVSGAPRS
ncbi:hypothetical protein ABZ370_27140 [Streptomyces sp. NPDC005962]|uniref:hypothetical protein n=1 Tax=Streptomyces sp. NPDC005962 TaxID=3154466 RepID=UPI0033F203F1